jgi:hypothetical protein
MEARRVMAFSPEMRNRGDVQTYLCLYTSHERGAERACSTLQAELRGATSYLSILEELSLV